MNDDRTDISVFKTEQRKTNFSFRRLCRRRP